MISKIDIFVPCGNSNALAAMRERLECEKVVRAVVMMDGRRAVAMETLREVAEMAHTEYIVLVQKAVSLQLGKGALERLLRCAVETDAALVYSDRYTMTAGVRHAHPVIDCQEGSIRDDFDFGALLLVNAEMLRKYVKQEKNDYAYAGVYALRLFLQRNGQIVHLNELLYTEEEPDTRKSGEKQFDYVDPRNRSVQMEMEQAVTEHLEAVGALVDTTQLITPDFNEQLFPVEASVVIPVFNRERTIADAVRSALSQSTRFDYNVIVVDNHSTDNTTQILRQLVEEEQSKGTDRLIHIIPQQLDSDGTEMPSAVPLGIGGCWNVAVNDERCGRFAVQLDSDDLYSSPDTLQRIVDCFHRQKAAMVIGSYRMCDFDLNTLPPGIIDHSEWTDQNGPNNALRINGLGAPRAFFTPLLRQIGFPNTSYGEDYALGLAFSRRYRIGRIYDELYLCRRWGGNSDAALSVEKVNNNNLYKDKLRTIELQARRKMNEGNLPIVGSDSLTRFFSRQMETWDEARKRYFELQNTQTRELGGLCAQWNPARIVSTSARIDKADIGKRPCFLCQQNRPKAQMSKPIATTKGGAYDMELLVNPFPILPHHYTIPLKKHEPQSIAQHFSAIGSLLDMYPQLLIFYNGPRCGASAPDHMHLQAGTSGIVPVQAQWPRLSRTLQTIVSDDNGDSISLLTEYAVPAFVLRTRQRENTQKYFKMIYHVMEQTCPVDTADGHQDEEPMMNIVAGKQHDEYITIIFPRRKHRPDCYSAEGNGRMMISPGALDMAGLIITPRENDFRAITEEQAHSILREVSVSDEDMAIMVRQLTTNDTPMPDNSRHLKRRATQPEVTVGIVSATELHFTLNGTYTAKGEDITGPQSVRWSEGTIEWNGVQYRELCFKPKTSDVSFSIEDVTIGISFHWERQQTQTFLGTLRLVVEEDKICAINELPVERYLESVISSEMSPTASLELLKAHAVISRSWLLAQMERRQQLKEGGETAFFSFIKRDDQLIRWHDRSDHTIFDVCADDHCQRYQGITHTAVAHVVAAVKATMGQVMAYDGEICDTRFSKCCGGVTEEYQYCWENIRKPYLTSVVDPYCNTQDKEILSEVLNDYDQETVDFHDWLINYTQAELSAIISDKLKMDFGRIKALEALERGKSGRISLLRIVGEKLTFTIGKELEVRKALSKTHLYSSAFTVKAQGEDADGYPLSFMLNGKGWGHGVGLCQIGAAVMGAKGIAYNDILAHYYTGAKIEKAY